MSDGTIMIYELDSRRPLTEIRNGKDVIRSLEFSPKQDFIACSDDSGEINLWDLGSLKSTFKTPGLFPKIAPNGRTMCVVSMKGLGQIWDLESHKVSRTIHGFDGCVEDSFCWLDDRSLIAGSLAEPSPIIYDVGTGKKVKQLQAPVESCLFVSLAVSGDGRWAAGGALQGWIILWDLKTGEVKSQLHDGAHWVLVSFCPNKPILAAAEGTQMGISLYARLVLWDIDRMQKIKTIVSKKPISCVRFSPNGSLLAAASGNQVRVWDVATIAPD